MSVSVYLLYTHIYTKICIPVGRKTEEDMGGQLRIIGHTELRAEWWYLVFRMQVGERVHLGHTVLANWRESGIFFKAFENLFYRLFCLYLDPVLQWWSEKRLKSSEDDCRWVFWSMSFSCVILKCEEELWEGSMRRKGDVKLCTWARKKK